MATEQRQGLADWLKANPARVVRWTLHVGEGRTTPAVGEVMREDYTGEGDALDAARLATDVEANLRAAGWGEDYPTARVFAYAAEGKNAVTTWTRTTRPAAAVGADGNPSTERELTRALVEVVNTMRNVVTDIAGSWKAEREYSTELAQRAASRDAEVVELSAANGMLETAVENHQKADELEVKLRGFDIAEKAMENAMASRMSPAALKKWAAKNPEKFATLKDAVRTDPELMALFLA